MAGMERELCNNLFGDERASLGAPVALKNTIARGDIYGESAICLLCDTSHALLLAEMALVLSTSTSTLSLRGLKRLGSRL